MLLFLTTNMAPVTSRANQQRGKWGAVDVEREGIAKQTVSRF